MKQRNNKPCSLLLAPCARSGFTLIEILIVVAIIAILASVVLVGLGPTQQAGRDARRLSDLREVQNALELYYGKCGFYPGGTAQSGCPTSWSDSAGWTALSTVLTTSNIGVNQVPDDPTSGQHYHYDSFSPGSTYTIGAALENLNNSAFVGYGAPTQSPASFDCTVRPNYCMSL